MLILLGFGCTQPQLEPELPDYEQDQPDPSEDFTIRFSASEQEVIGSWITQEASAFEEIIIEEDGTYFTFLNELPFDEGRWFWNDETSELKLSSKFNEKLSLKFVDIEIGNEALFLTDSDEMQHVWWMVDVAHE